MLLDLRLSGLELTTKFNNRQDSYSVLVESAAADAGKLKSETRCWRVALSAVDKARRSYSHDTGCL